MMSDQVNIFNLYMENNDAWQQEPTMHRGGLNRYWRIGKALHRIGAPAVEYGDGSKAWWQRNERHREDGPAFEWADGSKQWFLHNKEYVDATAWAEAVLKMHHKPHAADDVQHFLRAILTKEDLI
jgi:hypothetical protein